ncbi:CRISPR-associated protein, TM1801 family [Lachnospiraceae bacterium TWA4]|nr:CRISPR-associated protein, TM1801 family [Lachnospiraceae bacterium TWA4]
MIQNNRDFLFIYDATLCNPNGDPDQENKPRMDYDTKTLLVSDVRQKRNIRDFLSSKGYPIFVNTLNDKKVTMDDMFKVIMKKYDVEKADFDIKVETILKNLIDIRMFGSALAVEKVTKAITGPIQISWGYSLHPVDLVKSDSIVTIMNDDNSTFGKMYKAEYAMVAHCGSVNKFAAKKLD